MIFGKSSILEMLLGGNGKEKRLQQEEIRAKRAHAKLGVVLKESSEMTCRAARKAAAILSEDEAEFDLDAELLLAEATVGKTSGEA